MASKLTDEQRKSIIADFVTIGNYSVVAKMHGVSDTTVKRVVNGDPELLKKVELKKEQNSADILAHMETQKNKVCEIIDVYLDKLLDPEILSRATPSQLTTALGTLIDKFSSVKIADQNTSGEDDPLTKSLMEEAERMMKEG